MRTTRKFTSFRRDGPVALLIAPSTRVSGRVREIAPRVDTLTRSQRVRIALDNPADDFRLGTNITANASAQATGQIRIPAAALFEQAGKQKVWVVDPAAKTVMLRDVSVSRQDSNSAVLKAGLEPGDRVVTAGVHSLVPGQPVKIPEEAQ